MEKLKMQTPDLIQEHIEKIAELFPNVVVESLDGGVLRKTIDFDALKQELSDGIVEGNQERYQFTWPDKKQSVVYANTPITKTLRLITNKCIGKDGACGSIDSENIYIEGDNLDVLKLLQETYLGKIKMIYIDPPYNTGKDFVYNDDYKRSIEEYSNNSGQNDVEGNRLVQNSEANGRYHTDWLNMIYPRLRLAKDLLSVDGVIFISIDDNEVANLKKICDEIYNPKNFIGCLILQTATDNNPSQINTEHEYVLCYAKDSNYLSEWYAPSEKVKLIQDEYTELKGKYGTNIEQIQIELRRWIKAHQEELKGVTHYDNVDEKGVFHDGDIANTVFGGYEYEVIHPLTKKPCKIPDKGFRYPESTMREMIANNDIMFGADETTLIKPKKRLENAKDVLRSVIYEDGRSSTKQFESLMARDIFQNPKSPTILGRFISFIAESNDIVLDFFSGSGTTAESVLRLNAQNCKNIKFIMVQLPEDLDSNLQKADSRSKKTIQNAINFLDSIHRPHLITELGEERIQRAGKKIKQDNPLTTQNLDIGFRCFTVDSSNMKDVFYRPSETKQVSLDEFTDNIKEDRTSEDLLIQVMLDLGVLLSSKIEEQLIAGKKVFSVADDYLYACFDNNINDEVVKEIAKKKPVYAVFRDSGYANDSVAANFEQIFDTYSPKTIRKVL